mmetsp:Transcript_39126/g.94182  ORF Transcript_39126/g.94182 Transcript_39126/m.94182 type:complete len:395 (-) Transcript_39126:64-1248(-)
MDENGRRRRGGPTSNENLLQRRILLQQQLSRPWSREHPPQPTPRIAGKKANIAVRRCTKLCLFIAFVGGCIIGIGQYRWMSSIQSEVISNSSSRRPSAHTLLPSCRPHWKVATSKGEGPTIGGENPSRSAILPIKRIYFYHVRKAGGTMIRKYLEKVTSHYGIHLEMLEYQHAAMREEVGSRNDTIYVTNVRDPVSRSISHFKYDARWDCEQLVRNESFAPTAANANSLESWNRTKGFVPSPCDMPFMFTSCAVNCFVQAFSGRGCTRDGWLAEYNMALDRLLRYNMIFVFEKFADPNYVEAVESFFGVEGFNEPSDMFCGWEAKQANKRVPLTVKFDSVLKLTRLNEMDNRLYRDLVASCWKEENRDGEAIEYFFPEADPSRFIAQENRTVTE